MAPALEEASQLLAANWFLWNWQQLIWPDIDICFYHGFAFPTLQDLSQHPSPRTCKSSVIWTTSCWTKGPTLQQGCRGVSTDHGIQQSCHHPHHPQDYWPDRAMGWPLEGGAEVPGCRWCHLIMGHHSLLYIIYPKANTTTKCRVPNGYVGSRTKVWKLQWPHFLLSSRDLLREFFPLVPRILGSVGLEVKHFHHDTCKESR